jgi:squalene-hopene/tetraprenyl-beta-curcumene cyclase
MHRSLAAATALVLFAGSTLAQTTPAQPVTPTTPSTSAPAAKPAETKPDTTQMAAKAIAYLRSQQDPTGGWAVNPEGPTFPAITGLAVAGMLADPTLKPTDPMLVKGIDFMLSKAQPDGGIYDTVLPSYNTSICVAALGKVQNPSPQVKTVIKNAQDFLRTLQYGEGAVARPNMPDSAQPVEKSHAFYGGWGYGRHGRPDLSNTAFVLEGLHASGVPSDDPAFQRALVFLQRVQMLDTRAGTKVNEMEYAKGSKQGGFIYATSVSKDDVGKGQSQTALGPIEETLDDGTRVSRLRAYGSMTYAGFKSYLYAGLKKDDPRVQAALEWIGRNYTLTENPGAGMDGQYYFYVIFARAMEAYGDPHVRVTEKDGSTTERRWAVDLVNQLATLQEADGSFRPMKDGARWMEDNKTLITAYSLIALEAARTDLEKHPVK